jgi:pimeloyl-ACP methyl ester carboxylesterase
MTTINQSATQPNTAIEKREAPAYYRTLVRSGHAPVNGFEMYYEIHGIVKGKPLITIHPARGTANVFPSLIGNRQLIAVELRGRGRSTDIDRPLTLEQEADDVAALLKYLKIEQSDFFGESTGGVVAVMMAVRHPELIGRVATYGTPFMPFSGLEGRPARVTDGYPFQHEREGYEQVAPDPTHWPELVDKLVGMKWKGFSQDELRSIKAPVLIASGDHDDVPVEHSLEISRMIPNAQFAIIPGASHFVLSSDPEKLLRVIAAFIDEPVSEVPFGTAQTGYHPGVTR